MIQQSRSYGQLDHLNVAGYKPGSVHHRVNTQSNIICEIRRISVNIKLATSTNAVQSVGAKFSKFYRRHFELTYM